MPAGLSKEQRERNRADRMGGRGGGQYGGGGQDTVGRGYAERIGAKRAEAEAERAKVGKDEGRGGPFEGPGAGVAPFSRTKAVKGKKGPGTVGNIVGAGLTALGMGPLTAIGTIAGSEEITGIPGGILSKIGLGIEGPITDTTRLESDPSQLRESGMAQSDLAPPPAKKKKNNALGNIVGTLLADAGGTLVAG